MSKEKPSLNKGDAVYPGQVIGYVGNTGKQYTQWYRTEGGKDEKRELQSIRDEDRKYGYGAHLHVQFVISESTPVKKDKKGNEVLSSVNDISYNPIDYSIGWEK